jgi:hypothetical protein
MAFALLAWVAGRAVPRQSDAPGETTPSDLIAEDLETLAHPQPLSVLAALREWEAPTNKIAARQDPFAYGTTNAPELAKTTAADPPLDSLMVQAISIHADRAFAVLNRSIIGVGEVLGDWRVTSIQPDAITLRGPPGHFVLGIRRPPIPLEASEATKPTLANTSSNRLELHPPDEAP